MVLAPGDGWRNGDGDRGALMLQQRPSALARAKQTLSQAKKLGQLAKNDPLDALILALTSPPERSPALSDEERAKAIRTVLDRGKPPDARRRAYLSLTAPPQSRKKPGRKPGSGQWHRRNATIFDAITLIKQEYGLTATRNRATETASAASIVCEALRGLGMRISEPQINRIYADLDLLFRETEREIEHMKRGLPPSA
jgi:hypothetical protein